MQARPCSSAPTTAGTGSEATKERGAFAADGFKIVRDNRLVAELAIVDPSLLDETLAVLPQIAANGGWTPSRSCYGVCRRAARLPMRSIRQMQAFRRLLASLDRWRPAHTQQGYQRSPYACARASRCQCGWARCMAWRHRWAACPIPHGVVCGTLVAAAT